MPSRPSRLPAPAAVPPLAPPRSSNGRVHDSSRWDANRSEVAGAQPGRLVVLDGLRGLAILAVMFHHMTVMVPATRLDRVVASAAELGWVGVDLFFVLSGFLITGILLRAKGRPHYFRNFYARRTLRIFPLYYAVVFLSLVVLPHVPNPKAANFGRIHGDEIWYWTYLSNVIIGVRHAFRHGILDISWSLAIEEQFYLLWPAVVLLCSPRRLAQLSWALLAVSLLTRIALVLGGAEWITVYVLTPSRLDGLAVGALIALAARRANGLTALARRARAVVLGAAAVMIAVVVVQHAPFREGAAGETIGYSALALLFGALLVLLLMAPPHSRRSRVLAHPALTTLGKYSYALYLFHLPLRAVVRDVLYKPEAFLTIGGSALPGQLLFYAASMALSLAAAWLSWHLYEVHFLRLKRYFPEPRVTPAAATPTQVAAD